MLKSCDARVRIPIEEGVVSSLNASVAAAILLHGLRGTRKTGEDGAQAEDSSSRAP